MINSLNITPEIPDFIPKDLLWFEEEKRPYTVRVRDSRYLVCTKPFPARKTVLYTIVDLKKQIRATVGLVLNIYDFETLEGCKEALEALQTSQITLSTRNQIPLKIRKASLGRLLSVLDFQNLNKD